MATGMKKSKGMKKEKASKSAKGYPKGKQGTDKGAKKIEKMHSGKKPNNK